eukprot:c48960_g1_i1 orf=3-185(-)
MSQYDILPHIIAPSEIQIAQITHISKVVLPLGVLPSLPLSPSNDVATSLCWSSSYSIMLKS